MDRTLKTRKQQWDKLDGHQIEEYATGNTITALAGQPILVHYILFACHEKGLIKNGWSKPDLSKDRLENFLQVLFGRPLAKEEKSTKKKMVVTAFLLWRFR